MMIETLLIFPACCFKSSLKWKVLLKNVKTAAFKARPSVLMGVNNLFWDVCTYMANQWSTPVQPCGWKKHHVCLFLAVTWMHFLQHRRLRVHRGSLEPAGFDFIFYSLPLLFSSFSFFFSLLFPVFGVWFRQMFRSGLSCLQYALPMTVSPKMALTFTTGLNRPFLTPLFALTLLVSGNFTSEMLLLDVECLYL